MTEAASKAEERWKRKLELSGLPRKVLTRKHLEDELQRIKNQEQIFIKNLIKARKTEEDLKNNLLQLSRELRANNRVRHQSKESNLQDGANLPTVFVITPTFRRFVQKAELTRLSQAFKPVRKLHWIVVEDSVNKTALVANFLRNSGLKYTHLNGRTPDTLRRHKNEIRRLKPRGVVQRNLGIEWIRNNIDPHRTPGVVYFADDDNTYDSRIFDEVCSCCSSSKNPSILNVYHAPGAWYFSCFVRVDELLDISTIGTNNYPDLPEETAIVFLLQILRR